MDPNTRYQVRLNRISEVKKNELDRSIRIFTTIIIKRLILISLLNFEPGWKNVFLIDIRSLLSLTKITRSVGRGFERKKVSRKVQRVKVCFYFECKVRCER